MKLLIISSEPLNPADILSSTFELAQAKWLSARYTVAVLSVASEPAPSVSLKRSVRRLIGSAWNLRLRSMVESGSEAAKNLPRLLRPRVSVHVHTIEGIEVYEAVAKGLSQDRGFSEYLRAWVRAGRQAFAAYCRTHGQPDLIQAHGRFLTAGALALDIKNADRVPYIYTEHSTYFERNLAPDAARPALEAIVDGASIYTAVSPAVVAQVESYLQRGIPGAVIVANVVDEIYEATVDAAARPRDRFAFINVASLCPHKGVELLLRAFRRAFEGDQRYELQICGDGPLRADLERLAIDLEIERQVRFLGYQPKERILDLIDQAHVLVLASSIETFGVVVIEALARGRPVVATRCGATPTLVRNECGILVDVGDVEQLAAALKEIAATYPRFDSASIRAYALQHYGSGAFIDRMGDLYDAALRRTEVGVLE